LRDLNVFGTDEQAAWARDYADRYAAPARRIGALLAMLGSPGRAAPNRVRACLEAAQAIIRSPGGLVIISSRRVS